jgi:hypothetical protein
MARLPISILDAPSRYRARVHFTARHRRVSERSVEAVVQTASWPTGITAPSFGRPRDDLHLYSDAPSLTRAPEVSV